MRKAKRKISLLLILCMVVSMLPASVAADNSDWLAVSGEPADETPVVAAPSGGEDLIALTADELDSSTARDLPARDVDDDVDNVDNDEVKTDGKFESGASWRFNKDTGTLTISEKGEIPGFDDLENIPWKSFVGQIVNITVGKDVTVEGGACEFQKYGLLSTLTVPAGMTISETAFANCPAISSVTVRDKWKYNDQKLTVLSNVTDTDAAKHAPWAALAAKVTEVSIAANVKYIAKDKNVFANMGNLTDSGNNRSPVVSFAGTVNDWLAIGGDCTAEGLRAGSDKYLLVKFEDGSLIGKCGANTTFAFDGASGTLKLSGTGALWSEEIMPIMPWYSVRGAVTKLVIGAAVQGLTDKMFQGMSLSDSGSNRRPVVDYEGRYSSWTGAGAVADGKGLKVGGRYLLVNCLGEKGKEAGLLGLCGKGEDESGNETFVTFLYDAATRKLTIDGTGAMDNFTSYTMPWYTVRGIITGLDINTDPTSHITDIGSYAFYSCTELTSVVIPDTVVSVGSSAFAHCTKLENLEICSGSENLVIGDYAFWMCESLKNIGSPATTGAAKMGIPKRVTTIGQAAFRSSGLVYKPGGTAGHIYYEGSREDWAKIKEGKGSPNVRDGKLLTGETNSDEATYAIIHYMSADPTGNLYHDLAFERGFSLATDPPDAPAAVQRLAETDVVSSIVKPAIIGGTVAEDTNFKVPACTFTRDGYTFKSWKCGADGLIYNPGDIFIMPTKDVKFTALWTVNTPTEGDEIDQIIETLTKWSWIVPQDAAASQTELLAWLYKEPDGTNEEASALDECTVHNVLKKALDGKNVTASYRIQMKSFRAAVMGIENMTRGQDGRFAFDLHLTFNQEGKGTTKATASIKDGVIEAIPFNPNKEPAYDVTFELAGGVLPKPLAPDHKVTEFVRESGTSETPDETSGETSDDTSDTSDTSQTSDTIVKVIWKSIGPGKTFLLPECKHSTDKNKVFSGWRCSLEDSKAKGFLYRANAQFMMRTENVTFTAEWKDVPPSNSNAAVQVVTAAGLPQLRASNLEALVSSEQAAGRTASVMLEAAPVDTNSPETARIKAASLADNMTFVELSLYKTVDGETSAVADTNGTLVAVTLPFDGKNAENVKVYRDHEGVVDVLTEGGSGERISVADDSLTIYAGKFSVYAIAFDRRDGGSGGTGSGGSGSVSGGGSGGGSSKPSIINREPTASNPAAGSGVPNGNVPSRRFNDVPPDAWYYEAANWAYDQKIAKGEGGRRFNPNKLCTRAEMLTFLWRALGSPEPSGTGKTFSDVSSGSYYAKAVQWAAGQQIVKGEGGRRFNPDAPVTRGEAITLLYRAVGVPAAASARFKDVPEGAYYAEAVEWAVSRDIAKGMGSRSFSPASPCTRAQVLTFLYRSQS